MNVKVIEVQWSELPCAIRLICKDGTEKHYQLVPGKKSSGISLNSLASDIVRQLQNRGK
jgi:hypothetical protein